MKTEFDLHKTPYHGGDAKGSIYIVYPKQRNTRLNIKIEASNIRPILVYMTKSEMKSLAENILKAIK